MSSFEQNYRFHYRVLSTFKEIIRLSPHSLFKNIKEERIPNSFKEASISDTKSETLQEKENYIQPPSMNIDTTA